MFEPVDTASQQSGGDRKTSISQRIGQFKEAGLLDSLISESTSRSALETNDDEQLLYFINNTDAALDEIAQSENGEVQLKLIDAMLNGATVGETADIMAEISEDMAAQYLTAMEEQVDALEAMSTSANQSRSLVNSSNIRDIKLTFYDSATSSPARGAYDANFATDTVVWYIGFCAATIAGCYAASSWIPWVKIPGIVVAVAGGVSMGVQLTRWLGCSEFLQFCSTVYAFGKTYDKNKEYDTNANKSYATSITGHFNGVIGSQLLVIAGTTTVTVLVCQATTFGKAVISTGQSIWNAIVAKITSLIPPGININGSGIVLIKRI
jgi:hypothetical protein